MADKNYDSKNSTKSSQSTSKNKDLVEKVLIAHDIQRRSADYNQPPPLPDSGKSKHEQQL